jgi:two-component system, LytTR family, sensor kinase
MNRSHWRGVAIVAVAAIAQTLLVATQNYLAMRPPGRPPAPGALPFLTIIQLELPAWLAWGATIPVVVALVRRFPVTRERALPHLAVHLGAGAAIGLIVLATYSAVRRMLVPELFDRPYLLSVGHGYRRAFALLLLNYAVMAAIAHALEYRRALEARVLRAAQLETLLAQARLEVLRVQLQPHFLFNALHTVSSLMEDDVRGARRVLARLGDLLRRALEPDAGPEATLDEELAFLDEYVDVQRARFPDRLRYVVDVEAAARRARVPRLVLQPLVENAIRHGLAPRAEAGTVTVAARVEGDRLRVVVRDDGLGFADPSRVVEGVGLGNTRKRLEHLYGAEARLLLENAPEGGARVTLDLPRREDGPA